jgi:hypothetical protein
MTYYFQNMSLSLRFNLIDSFVYQFMSYFQGEEYVVEYLNFVARFLTFSTIYDF